MAVKTYYSVFDFLERKDFNDISGESKATPQ
jgi:hypothetical protein